MKKRILIFAPLACLLIVGIASCSPADRFSDVVKSGTPEQVQAAIKNGADVNAKDGLNQTPLMYAAINSNPEVVQILLKAGANPQAHDNLGDTPLMSAVEFSNIDVILALLTAGADAKAKNHEGKTALDIALRKDSLKGTDALAKLQQATGLSVAENSAGDNQAVSSQSAPDTSQGAPNQSPGTLKVVITSVDTPVMAGHDVLKVLYQYAKDNSGVASVKIDVYLDKSGLTDKYGNPVSQDLFMGSIQEDNLAEIRKYHDEDALAYNEIYTATYGSHFVRGGSFQYLYLLANQ